jgi:hypothetical protein
MQLFHYVTEGDVPYTRSRDSALCPAAGPFHEMGDEVWGEATSHEKAGPEEQLLRNYLSDTRVGSVITGQRTTA